MFPPLFAGVRQSGRTPQLTIIYSINDWRAVGGMNRFRCYRDFSFMENRVRRAR